MPQIETLTTVWDADYAKLEKKLNNVIKANFAAANKIEQSWGKVNDKLDNALGASTPGLKNFGAASLAAAAGATTGAAAVGALVAAFAGARQAAQFSADLKDAAERVHVTTDALQEYQYALGKVGGQSQDVEGTLNAFSETLGKASAGVKSALKPFQELFGNSFTKDDVKRLGDADQALLKITERVQGLSNTQSDAVLQQLGLEKMAPLIREGADEMERLRAEAHKVGVVMDADLIKRGAELNDQFETVSKVIDIQLKSALVDLGPILVGLLKLVADLARAAASVADNFRSVQNKSLAGLQDRASTLRGEVLRLGTRELAGQKLSAAEQGVLARNRAQLAEVNAEIASRQAVAPPVRPTSALTAPVGKARKTHTPRDMSDERTAQVEAQLDAAERDLLQAWASLRVSADGQAEIQRMIVDVEREILNDRLDKQQADIRDDKGLTAAKKAQLVASLETVRGEQAKVADLKKELIERERVEQNARDALSVTEAGLEAQEDVLRAQEALATTAAQRREIELRLLDLADQREKAELDAIIASKETTAAEKDIARKKLATLDATRGNREEAVRRQTAGPLEQFTFDNSAVKAAERFEAITVNAFDNLSDGLAQAIAYGDDLGDTAKRVFQQMIADLLAASIKKSAATLLTAFIPGFASGTSFAPGGIALVGEKGPELVKLPRGSQVTPTNETMRALQALAIPRPVQPTIVHQSYLFDAKGAVMTDDLLARMNQMVNVGKQQAVAESARVNRQALPAANRSVALLGR